jgi:hypothetical protein
MIPYDVDPSLHTCEPEPPLLDDGFSPPSHETKPEARDAPPAQLDDPALLNKSAF